MSTTRVSDLLWGHFDQMEIATINAYPDRFAPKEPDGCYEGKDGPALRNCTGYGIHRRFGKMAARHGSDKMVRWLLKAIRHYPAAHDAIMKANGHPPGEYVEIDHSGDRDKDYLRHTNPSSIFWLLWNPRFLNYVLEDGTRVKDLLQNEPGLWKTLTRVAIETGNWLFEIDWFAERNWHIRHHYPIMTAIALYKFLGNPIYIQGASMLLQAFWSNPAEITGIDGRPYKSYDTGTRAEGGRHFSGSSQLTFWPWYQGLAGNAIFELYLQPPVTHATRKLCETIIENMSDWYLFRETCPLGDLEHDGDSAFINSPMQGSILVEDPENPPSYWLTPETEPLILSDEAFDDLPDDAYFWPYLMSEGCERDGAYFKGECDGEVRYHHPRRYVGGPKPLGPTVELSGPGKSIASLLAIRAALETNRNPTLAETALRRARRLVVEQSLFMHKFMSPLRKKDLLGYNGIPDGGWFGTTAGNNRHPYWVLEGYRVARDIDEQLTKAPPPSPDV